MVGRRGTQGYGYGTQMKSIREVTAVPAVLSSYPPRVNGLTPGILEILPWQRLPVAYPFSIYLYLSLQYENKLT